VRGQVCQIFADGDHPYVPPKSGRGKPVTIPNGTAWKDNKGRTWKWDRLHKDHWDVTDKDGDHINVQSIGQLPMPDECPEAALGAVRRGGRRSSMTPPRAVASAGR